MGLIRRSFSYLDCEMFKKLYTTLVHPHLEYAQSVWSPHLRKHIKQLENVQIRTTKLVDGMKHPDYSERLKKLDLPTLLNRRERGDIDVTTSPRHPQILSIIHAQIEDMAYN